MCSVKIFSGLPLCKKEVLRYAGCKSESGLPEGLLEDCIKEVEGVLSYKVCYMISDVKTADGRCDFGSFAVRSNDLARNLADCGSAVVFAATVGVGIDRLISKYSAVSPLKAVLFQAIGAERIEALCDAFCADIQRKTGLYTKPRFSPGYGDLDLVEQRSVFRVLNCRKLIGLTLTDSCVMAPSKSVTAIAGLSENFPGVSPDKCAECGNKDCAYRGV